MVDGGDPILEAKVPFRRVAVGATHEAGNGEGCCHTCGCCLAQLREEVINIGEANMEVHRGCDGVCRSLESA